MGVLNAYKSANDQVDGQRRAKIDSTSGAVVLSRFCPSSRIFKVESSENQYNNGFAGYFPFIQSVAI